MYDRRPPIAFVTLNRPQRLNALTGTLVDELERCCAEIRDDPRIRAFVIRGEGRCFSSGYDIADPSGTPKEENDPSWWRETAVRSTERWKRALWDNPKPSVVAVHSYCLAGATQIASFADFVIASDDALFGYPPVRYGSVAVHCIWPYHIGLRKAKELTMTGNLMSAQEALSAGFVNRVVPGGRLVEEATRFARTLSKVSPLAAAHNKFAVNRVYELMGMDMAFENSANYEAILYSTDRPGHRLEFRRWVKERGLAEALKERDRLFLEEDAWWRKKVARKRAARRR